MTSLHSVALQSAEERKLAHYPSLELCKKLTANWFPKTEKCWTRSLKWDEESKTFPYELSSRPTPWGYYFAASVMELLDELPQSIIKFQLTHWLSMYKRDFWDNLWQVCYYNNWSGIYRRDTLPNALAEMWLWLKENNYLIK